MGEECLNAPPPRSGGYQNFDTEVCSWLFASWPQNAELAGRSPLKSGLFTDAADCASSPEPKHIF